MIALQVIWFILLAFLLVGYTTLAGFDLGIGGLQLFARSHAERGKLFAAIGPFWDGNEVWLIAVGGALFAAFPPVYATIFSGFYIALMLALFALIVRAVSIDFGAKAESETGRAYWSLVVALGSLLAVLLFGVALGNLLRGLPLDAHGEYAGTVYTLLNPFALLLGVLNLAMILGHGALYLAMKTSGELSARARHWASIAWGVYLPLALASINAAAYAYPHLLRNFRTTPAFWLVPAAAILAIILFGLWNRRGLLRPAFLASASAIILLLASAAIALFPNLIPALGDPARSLTIYNASSSHLTLKVMFIVALIGMPLVIGYTVWVYRMFSGEVKEGAHY